MADVTDSFTGTDGTALASYSANWTDAILTHILSSNRATWDASAAYHLSFYSGATFSNDQYGQVAFLTGTTNQYVGPAVRCNNTSGGNGYAAFGSGATIQKAVNGVWTDLGIGTGAWANTDTIKLDVTGNLLTVYKNGVSVTSTNDNSHSAGSPGIGSYNNGGNAYADDFLGGPTAGAGGGTVVSSGGLTTLGCGM